MKKCIIILILLLAVTTGVFSQGWFSLGFGGLFDWNLNNGISSSYQGERFYLGNSFITPGAFVFFDFTYAELEVNFTHGFVRTISNHEGPVISSWEDGFWAFGAGLLGKIPFYLDGVYIFPLLGAHYNLVFHYSGIDSILDMSQFGILGGVGMDFDLSDTMFLRAEALFHFRFSA